MILLETKEKPHDPQPELVEENKERNVTVQKPRQGRCNALSWSMEQNIDESYVKPYHPPLPYPYQEKMFQLEQEHKQFMK